MGTRQHDGSDAEPAGQGERDWFVDAGRVVGRMARQALVELEGLAAHARKTVQAFDPKASRHPSRSPRKRVPLEVLLVRLGRLVSEHAASDYQLLRHEPAFWSLVAQLAQARTMRKPSVPDRDIRGPQEAEGQQRGETSERGMSSDLPAEQRPDEAGAMAAPRVADAEGSTPPGAKSSGTESFVGEPSEVQPARAESPDRDPSSPRPAAASLSEHPSGTNQDGSAREPLDPGLLAASPPASRSGRTVDRKPDTER